MANPWDDDEIISPAPARARTPNQTFHNPPVMPSSLDVRGLYGQFQQQFPNARVTSTVRTPGQNAQLPNAADNSFHLTGEAWDAVPGTPDEEQALVNWGTQNGFQVEVERAPYHVHFEPPARGITTSTLGGSGGAGGAGGNPWDDDEIIEPAPTEEGLDIDIVGDPALIATPEDLAENERVVAEAEGLRGMDRGDRFLAGVGQSIDSTYRGLKQLGTSMAAYAADSNQAIVPAEARAWLHQSLADQHAEEAEARRLNAPLLATDAGQFGSVTGSAAQIVAPGGVAKLGTRVPVIAGSRAAPILNHFAAATMPATIRGNALLGAGLGAMQPVVSENERVGNAGSGAGLGAAGAAIAPVAGAIVRGGQRIVPAMRQSAQQRAAAQVINEFAENPAALRAAAANPQTIVPGSRPTLAETSEDLGLAGLQDTLASTSRDFSVALARRQQANNLARVDAIRNAFGGADDAAAAMVRDTRDTAARQILRPIESIPLGGLDKVQNGVTRLAQKHQASPAVRTAMEAVAAELPRIRTVGDAHAVRQYIGQLIRGQVEGKAGAKLAKRELMTVQSLLDREMRASFPEWGRFLRDYKTLSREADRIDVGAELLGTGRAVRTATDDPKLTPAAFARAASNMDRTAYRATGSRTAANRLLTPQQVQAVDDVRRDLERFARTQQDALPANSATVRRATGANDFRDAVGPVGAAMVEPVSGVAVMALNKLRQSYGAKVVGIVEEAMLNPQRAAEVLATLDPTIRQQVVRQIAPYVQRSLSSAGLVMPRVVGADEEGE